MDRESRIVRQHAHTMMSEGHHDKRWYLVSYDVRDPHRLRQTYKHVLGRGERIQYSLFRCRLTRTELEELRWELEKILEDEDDLMFVHLCPACAARVDVRGEERGWSGNPDRFDIL